MVHVFRRNKETQTPLRRKAVTKLLRENSDESGKTNTPFFHPPVRLPPDHDSTSAYPDSGNRFVTEESGIWPPQIISIAASIRRERRL